MNINYAELGSRVIHSTTTKDTVVNMNQTYSFNTQQRLKGALTRPITTFAPGGGLEGQT